MFLYHYFLIWLLFFLFFCFIFDLVFVISVIYWCVKILWETVILVICLWEEGVRIDEDICCSRNVYRMLEAREFNTAMNKDSGIFSITRFLFLSFNFQAQYLVLLLQPEEKEEQPRKKFPKISFTNAFFSSGIKCRASVNLNFYVKFRKWILKNRNTYLYLL